MLELITMSILSLCYAKACVDERIKEKTEKEKERIMDLKIKVFCYAVKNGINYDYVVKLLQQRKVTFEDLT